MATITDEFGGFAAGISVAALAIASQGDVMRQGALYSMGMELVTGHNGRPAFLPTGAPAYQLGANLLDPTDVLMRSQRVLPSGVISVEAAALKNANAAERALTNTAYRTTLANMVLPIAMTGVLGAMSYSEGGGEALGRFLVEDVFANYYGNKAVENLGSLTNRAQGHYATKLSGDANSLTQKMRSSSYHTLMGSSLAARMVAVTGAYMGAGIGFSAGQSIGEGLGNMLFEDGSNQGFGLAGGIFGARLGAQAGATMMRSIPALAASALVLGGAYMLADAGSDILKSGFKRTRSRGLDFAGDVSAYNTNSAVTMRQRALQSMHKSHLNARSALGQEASITHMNRDYFANYRRH